MDQSKNSEHQVETMRLNKYIAKSGICSRRKADELIGKGHVKVNGKEVREMGYRVNLDRDVVLFDGKVVSPETKKIYILLNKPKNTITTSNDEKGRKTVMDIVKNATDVRLFPVGRLDRNTTGLLMLTNDGDLAKKLSHPSYEIKKVYHASLDKKLTEEHLNAIANTLQLEDGPAPVDNVSFIKGKEQTEIGIEVHIGRNRIVRRIFEHLGYEVQKLDRVFYAGLTKKDLGRGRYRQLSDDEIIILKHLV